MKTTLTQARQLEGKRVRVRWKTYSLRRPWGLWAWLYRRVHWRHLMWVTNHQRDVGVLTIKEFELPATFEGHRDIHLTVVELDGEWATSLNETVEIEEI